MDKIYLKDNYIVTEIGGLTTVFPKNYSSYSENTTGFYLNSSFPVNNPRTVYIDFTRVTSIYDEAGLTAYSVSTLRSFFLTNTGFKSPSGGSGGVWGSITGTLSDQTDLQSALNAKQDTLISGTNIKTINGNTLLGSGDLTISTGITVGTTPVTSGTDGGVFFQSGGVVQQDSSLFWDNTNKRLGIGGAPDAYKLDVIGGIRIGSSSNLNNRIYFDDTTFRLGIGIATPTRRLDVVEGSSGLVANFRSSSGNISAISLSNNSSTADQIRFGSNGTSLTLSTNFTERARIDINGLFGIGTNSPQARLDVRAQGALSTDIAFRVRNSADTRNFLVVNGAGDVYNNGAGGVTSNTFYGENVGRSATGVNNTFIGYFSGFSNIAGGNNSFFGRGSGQNNTTASNNSFFGTLSGFSNSTGVNNTFIGQAAGQNNTTGGTNTFVGSFAALNNITGSNIIALGQNAGRFISGGGNMTVANGSIFIGVDTRANADNQTNQIVIGHNAIGTGSNSVTLGNTSITQTNLRGQIVISGFASAPTGVEGAIYYDSTTKKHYGFDGTNWNALY